MPMNPEIKAKWLGALRSGKYEQVKGGLKKDNCFCCLGVLTDIWAKENNTEWVKKNVNSIGKIFQETYSYITIPGSSLVVDDILPDPVAEWAGLGISDPEITYDNTVSYITHLNDEVGLTFKQIADLIEEQL